MNSRVISNAYFYFLEVLKTTLSATSRCIKYYDANRILEHDIQKCWTVVLNPVLGFSAGDFCSFMRPHLLP